MVWPSHFGVLAGLGWCCYESWELSVINNHHLSLHLPSPGLAASLPDSSLYAGPDLEPQTEGLSQDQYLVDICPTFLHTTHQSPRPSQTHQRPHIAEAEENKSELEISPDVAVMSPRPQNYLCFLISHLNLG